MGQGYTDTIPLSFGSRFQKVRTSQHWYVPISDYRQTQSRSQGPAYWKFVLKFFEL